SFYDLPIALSILQASHQIPAFNDKNAFIGELSLSGEVKSINGVLPMVIKAKELGFENIFIPEQNLPEGTIVAGINVFPVKTLSQLAAHLERKTNIEPGVVKTFEYKDVQYDVDFKEVKGQLKAKRAIEVAVAGGHNILLIGVPGAGKSMLAKRIPSILPPMTFEEAVETTKIYSIVGNISQDNPLCFNRPFRAPHQTISLAGLTGGGSVPMPGEISLAHNGVLFLDELPEFARATIEGLRQPMEDKVITISRAKSKLTYPSSVMVVAAMNPCPCGFYGHPTKKCKCTPGAVEKYLSKVSGPMLDRIDIHVEVAPVEFSDMANNSEAESSEKIRARITKARKIQWQRFKNLAFNCNADISAAYINSICQTTKEAANMMKIAFEKLSFSARAYNKILKIARTIADLDEENIINSKHIAEALQYRSLDRRYWR
ncbi:MAG: YifB family Mg chelatase-like AAA ATPase, partial [Oscillospiraceae bacterium]|nr:YifB family Mg chelatase-like AAA ATPase [Oscillospiraceae bacterium]